MTDSIWPSDLPHPRDDPRSVNELISAALSEPDEDRASDAISALQCRGSREVFEEAARLAPSHCPKQRRLAANILAHLGWPGRTFPDECIRILLGMLEAEDGHDVLRSTLVALGHYRRPEVIVAVSRFRRHPNAQVRDGVVSAFLGCEDPRAIEALVELTNDEVPYLRDYATFGLGAQLGLDTPEIREALAARLDDPDADIRGEAMLGLIRRGDPRVLAALQRSLDADPISISEVEAASLIGEPDLHPQLVALRERWDVDKNLLEEAIRACGPVRHTVDEILSMHIEIPDLSLVVLLGPSGSGKSTFARKHFRPTEVLSSDACRAMVSDDENDQTVTKDAFEVLQFIAGKRLALGRLTVVDATNVQPEARKPYVELARQFHCLPVAFVLNLPESVCLERNRQRADRNFGPHVVRNQKSQLRRSLGVLRKEGFRHIFVIETPEEAEAATVERVPLWTDKRAERGPFDIIGDIHGCADELEELLQRLGYEMSAFAPGGAVLVSGPSYAHPLGRKAIFLGDLVDRGPRILDTVRLVRNMVLGGSALCVPGNHDVKLVRKLRGKNVQITHGLAETLAEIDALPEEVRGPFCKDLADFLDDLVSHYVLDEGRLVVAHAGMKQEMQGRGSGRVREFALYGETTGETDEFGLPIRFNWAAEYRGPAMVVYGHTPVPEPDWLNRTVNIDTGCVFGGKLTALRYPEREFVSIPAARTYREPSRPFLPEDRKAPTLSAQQSHDTLLDAEDVMGKRIIPTRLRGSVTIREENAAAALEVMSRFAADPRWLIYLPPTMSPCETSREPGLLEHPAEAFAYYRNQGAPRVVCEEKHMGSRAVVIVCRDEAAARARFGIETGEVGIVSTRTGRRFFNDPDFERCFLDRVRTAVTAADLWARLETTWSCLDCELMPWSAKAQELLKTQYAAVGSAGLAALPRAVAALTEAASRLDGTEQDQLLQLKGEYRRREQDVGRFVAAYRHYCWPVSSLNDLKLAPFHLLATEGRVHVDRGHLWHMEILAEVCRTDPEFLLATPYKVVDVTDPAGQAEGIAWWEELTGRGGEGMVVKPLDFIHKGSRALSQPAVKCRGREYLRIIYGPEYTTAANLDRLRSRGLGRKRSLALGEFALGIEGLERFVRKEPLRRVHECVFGVLALESEPVDPRL